MHKLAVYSPDLGVISETFIKKHIEEILPGKTVSVAGSNEPSQGGQWKVDVPTYIVGNRNSISLNLRNKTKRWITFLRRLGLKPANDLYYDKSLAKFLTEHEVKVILGEYLNYSTTIIDLAKKLNIKVFAHAHGYDVSKVLRQKFWRREYARLNKVDGIITVSEYSKNVLIDLGIKKELIHVIPCGVSFPDNFRKEYNNNKFVKCIAVGRMVSKKAPLLLLESFMLASKKNDLLRLDYIGTGPLYDKAAEYLKEHNLENKVKLHGSQPHDVVIRMMKEADIMLQHSITPVETGDQEGLPVGILEGMGYCLPVVSTLHAGIPEAVKNNESGFLVKEGDTHGMAEAIVKLAEEENLRIKMGKAGRDIIEKKFSWEIEKNSLLKLLKAESDLL